jgi:thiamine-monophosphate kinase
VKDAPPSRRRTLREAGEFGFIGAVRREFGGPDRPGELGIGDDAAVLPVRGRAVLSTDMLVEGTHFSLDYFRPAELGFRALSANLSDLAAMGAKPLAYLVAVAAPPDVPIPFLRGLYRGMALAAAPAGMRLVGGDTVRGEKLVLSVTVAGEAAPGKAVLRSGARPGDLVVVTGQPGWSRLGLSLLSKGRPARASGWRREAMGRHLTPVARWREGIAAARSGAVRAMIDVSDGVLPDLGHLLEEGGLGARLDAAAFPLPKPFLSAAAALGVDPLHAFLSGGEDYELLMAVPPRKLEALRRAMAPFPCGISPIGVLTAGGGVSVSMPDGREVPGDALPPGFLHFGPRR